MNSKLENFLLTKDFKDLSPQDKLYVSSFINEVEYTEYRSFLKKSREAFRMDMATIEEPNINSEILLQSYRDKYTGKKNNSTKSRIKGLSYYSNPKYLGIAATIILFVSILGVYIKTKFFDLKLDVATEYLLERKEIMAIPALGDESYSREVTNLYSSENDSLNNELDKMNEHLVIRTEGLDVEVINPTEELY
jgi:hypothetical protein